jgi:hypothetical protein
VNEKLGRRRWRPSWLAAAVIVCLSGVQLMVVASPPAAAVPAFPAPWSQAVAGGCTTACPSSPPGRTVAAQVYDAGHGQVVVFGGAGNAPNTYLNDTWVWNGNTWSQVAGSGCTTSCPSSPPGRIGAAAAYDAGTGQVVIFGGFGSAGLLNDTWVWNGTSWFQFSGSGCGTSCPSSPPGRVGASIAYDPASGKLVLFGGSPQTTNTAALNDTWVWNGNSWSQVAGSGCSSSCASSPPARYYPSFADDPATGQVVLFGGYGRTAVLNDTWVWNGSQWSQVAGSGCTTSCAGSPPPRDVAGLAFDKGTNQLVLFGGGPGATLDDTWAWNGGGWFSLDSAACTTSCPSSPPGRKGAGLSFDINNNGLVLFGGQGGGSYQNDTWIQRTCGTGYWLVASDGGIFAFGAPFYGSAGGARLLQPVVGMAGTPDGGGYWLAAADGGLFTYGNANFAGGGVGGNAVTVGIARPPGGGGYWLATAAGRVAAFGSARDFGSITVPLAQPIVGIASTPDGGGYWLVATDGGIFSFGDAVFYGSTGAQRLNRPIVGMASTASGHGYWLVASDGGIFAFGDAPYLGSTGGIALVRPVVGMAATADGGGYWMVASDGGIFTFGDAQFCGSTGGFALQRPIVAIGIV